MDETPIVAFVGFHVSDKRRREVIGLVIGIPAAILVLLAALVPAPRAAGVNPTDALRRE